jgi:hypothetical protein
MSKRFTDQAENLTPADDDILVGTDISTGEDVKIPMTAIAAKMRVLLADALVSSDDRIFLEAGPPAIGVRYRYYRGATAPAISENDADPGPGWEATLPGGTDAVWRIEATFNDGVFVAPWSVAVQLSGEAGIAGLAGDDGTPGNIFFYQNDAPAETDRQDGDTWWDVNDNYKQYRWVTGTGWVQSFAPMLTIDANGNVTEVIRAGVAGAPFQILASAFQVWNGTSALAPFEIISDVVYIKQAVIRQLSAAKIIGGTITGQEIVLSGLGAVLKSDNYDPGEEGWKIDGEGAEFPALIVRNSMIEANAITRRYGSNFTNSGLLADGVWTEIASLTVVMASGDTAHVDRSVRDRWIHSTPTTRYLRGQANRLHFTRGQHHPRLPQVLR